MGARVSVHLTLGLPDETRFDADAGVSTTRYGLIRRAATGKHEYALSYNATLKVANWVAWELNASWLGSQPRTDSFRADDTLPVALQPGPQLVDYAEPVYDRGHLCPSGDRTLDRDDNDSTFLLTNIVPQASSTNQGPWALLEDELRAAARSGREVFVVAGPHFAPPIAWTLGGTSGVAVPTSTWKVAVVLGAPGDGVSAVGAGSRVIGVLMPNAGTLLGRSDPWTTWCASPRAIEGLTGLDFLADVPRAVQDALEVGCDPACDPTSASFLANCR
jgi:endonuclease G